MSDQSNPSTPNANGIPVVGIGASAGGLEAFRRFLSALPSESGMAFVLVQHLDPDHKSLMAELLAKSTAMPVIEIKDNLRIEPNHVYMIPPNRFLSIEDSVLHLSESPKQRGVRMVIDHFFRSLAEDRRNRAICIVLSGTGSDGTAGLRAVKANGGLAMAQDPKTADYDGMPASAIATDSVDYVLPVEKMPEALLRYAAHPYLQTEVEAAEELPDEAADGLLALLGVVKNRTDFDFGHYKTSTLSRRVQRRMGLQHVDTFDDYLRLVRETPDEVNQLLKDLLINVTDFFRDREAFDALEQKVIPALIDETKPQQPIRVWVPGCATGEEAYSIAMVLLEQIDARRAEHEVQIFASDVDEECLKSARAGRYPASVIADIPSMRLERFFDKEDDGGDFYRVNKRLRRAVSFAVQNLIADPPFSKLDLVSCRNLMIYLRPSAQQRLMQVFHFALKPGRFLFLGGSETIGRFDDLFEPVSKKWRIYRRIDADAKLDFRFPLGGAEAKTGRGVKPVAALERVRFSASSAAQQVLLDNYAPAAVVVTRRYEIRYLHGDLGHYLTLPRGEPHLNLIDMLHDSLRTRVRAAMYKAARDEHPVTVSGRYAKPDGEPGVVRIQVTPTTGKDDSDGLLLVAFEPQADTIMDGTHPFETDDGAVSRELEAELQATREDLRSTVEELEASNEELKSSNEEIMSMNEELQSANEELETSAEETRSLNEELTTVNSQLKDKLEELEAANNDLSNFFASTKLATVFLDPELRIKRFTPAIAKLLPLIGSDIGRPISDIARGPLAEDLTPQVQQVMDSLAVTEKELCDEHGHWHIRRILPYRTDDNRIRGVVITFTDVTGLKQTTQQLDARLKQQAVVAELGQRVLGRHELKSLFDEAVRRVRDTLATDYCKVLRYSPEDKELLLIAGVGWQEGLVGAAKVPDDIGSQAGFTLKVKAPVVVEDLTAESRFSGPTLLLDHSVRSGISVVIEGANGPYGVIGAHSRARRRFSAYDADFLQSVANVLSSAVQHERADRALRASERRFRLLTSALPQIVLTVQRDGAIGFANDRWTEVTGTEVGDRYPKEQWLAYLHPDDRDEFRQRLDQALAEAVGFEAEVRLYHSAEQPRYRWQLVRGLALDPDYHRTQHWLLSFNDIQDQKQAQMVLTEADRQKNDFLAMLAHELRNPLAPIRNAAKVLEAYPSDDPTIVQVRGVIQRQAAHLTRLVDDLLDVARITRNAIDLRKQKVEFTEIINAAAEAKRPRMDEAHQALTIDMAQEPLWLEADPTRLVQIVTNLLDNASKYSPDGAVIRICVRREQDQALLSVCDTGKGLTAKSLERIFDLFTQADTTLHRSEGGLGLGLALVKQLVALHGGTIRAHSEGLGKGSEFCISLPLCPPPSQGYTQHASPPQSQILPKARRILVVDDNRDAAATLAVILDAYGYTSQTAYDGKEALAAAADFAPDLILLDIGLPQMDGYQVAQRIRQDHGNGITLVAVTGYGQDSDIQEAYRAGFDMHLLKPVDPDEMLAIVQNAAAKH